MSFNPQFRNSAGAAEVNESNQTDAGQIDIGPVTDAPFPTTGGNGTWVSWLDAIAGVLVLQRGASSKHMNVSGVALPMISGLDTLAIGALVAAPVVMACRRITGYPGPAISRYVKADGELVSTPAINQIAFSDGYSWQQYLMHPPSVAPSAENGRRAWIRDGHEPGGITLPNGKVFDVQLIEQVRGLIDKWEDMVTQSTQGIHASGAITTGPMAEENIGAFFYAVHRLCSDLDGLGEVAAMGTNESIIGGLKAAGKATESFAKDASEYAGKGIAEGLNLAGEAAGKGIAGLLSGIGAAGYVVGAIIIYIAFYR